MKGTSQISDYYTAVADRTQNAREAVILTKACEAGDALHRPCNEVSVWRRIAQECS